MSSTIGVGGSDAKSASHSYIGRVDRPGPILAAADGGDESTRVIGTAVTLGAALHAPVEVVSVVPAARPFGGVALGMEPAPESEALRRRRELSNATAALGELQVPTVLAAGSPPRVIAELARDRQASLVVLGRRDAVLGAPHDGRSIAAKVARLAPCPVLAVRSRWTSRSRRTVVACDFSIPSVWAAETAARLTEPTGRIDVVHVLPTGRIDQPEAGWATSYREWCDAQFSRLQALLARSSDAPVELVLTAGEAGLQVLAEAHVRNASLLAFGMSGAGMIERMLVGGVASDLFEHGDRDLLIAPHPAPRERDRLASAMLQRQEHADPAEWADALDGFSTRHDGQRAWLETVDPERGGFAHETGFVFNGASYDRAAGRILLMLGRGGSARDHVTRSIAAPEKIAVHADAWGRETALSVWHGEGVTELRIFHGQG
jgi:nucleotide-binding universal stress UspA family protein